MTEETKHNKAKKDEKILEAPKSEETKTQKVEETKAEKKETKAEEKKVEPKKKEKPKRKREAIAYGNYLHMSMKQGKFICKFIKGKSIDKAISDLEKVLKYKMAVPFTGEIPHRKGKGIMSGRYPIRASKMFIPILKSLKGNSITNGMDIDRTKIVLASASWASRPMRRGGTQGKRTNLIIRAREIPEMEKKR